MDSALGTKAAAKGEGAKTLLLSISRIGQWLQIPIIIAAAAVLRLYGLQKDSLWFDTAHSVALADHPTLAGVIGGAATDFQSPLYFILLHFWLPLGYNDTWVKLLSVLIGLAVVAMTFITAEALFSRRTAALAGLLTALSSYQVFYSRYPRGYILMALLVLVSLWALYRAFKEDKARYWGLYVLATILGLYTHPYYLLVVMGQGVFATSHILTISPQRARHLLWWGGASAFVFLAFAPWLGVLWTQWKGVQGGADAWIQPVSFDTLQQLYFWLWHRTKGDYWPLVALPLWVGVYGMTGLLIVSAFKRTNGLEKWVLWSTVLFPIAIAFGLSVLATPFWDPRYFVYISAPFYILVAQALSEAMALVKRFLQTGIAAAVAFIFAVSLPPLYSLYNDPNYRTPELAESAAWLQDQYREGDLIIHTNYQSYLPYLWYGRSLSLSSASITTTNVIPCVWPSLPEHWCQRSRYRESLLGQEEKDLSAAAKSAARVWLVTLYNHTRDGENESRKTDEEAERLTAGLYQKSSVHRFLGVNIYELKPTALKVGPFRTVRALPEPVEGTARSFREPQGTG